MPMTPQALAKRKATEDENRVLWASQHIQIDEDWSVSRFDELNWEVQHNGNFHGFYGTLFRAFQALPAKMMNEGAKNSLAACYSQ